MSSPPTNTVIAAALERIASLLELEGAQPTPVSAYRRAAAAIAAAPRPAAELVEEDGVEALHELGIGYLISGLVTDWIRSGELPLLERLERKHDPEACLRRVPGIGPKLAHEVHELGIDSVDELVEAAESGQLETVYGFGPKRIAQIRATRPHRSARRHGDDDGPVQLDLLAS